MNRFLAVISIVFFLGMWNLSIAQNALENPYQNRAILRHYTGGQLSQIEEQSPGEFEKIKFYYLHSFQVTMLDCDTCAVDYDTFFNLDLFDVTNFEALRLTNTAASFDFKEIYHVQLKSQLELNATFSSIQTQYQEDLRPLPDWIDTGSPEQDYAAYKAELNHWAVDFPEEFRQITSSRELFKVRIADFLSATPERRTYIMNHPWGYMIVD